MTKRHKEIGSESHVFHLPPYPLFSPMILPNLCFGVSSLDLGLEADRTAFTAVAAAVEVYNSLLTFKVSPKTT